MPEQDETNAPSKPPVRLLDGPEHSVDERKALIDFVLAFKKPLYIAAGDWIGIWGFNGYNGSAGYNHWLNAHMSVTATEDFTGSGGGTAIFFATTPNGGSSWIGRVTIQQDGGLIHDLLCRPPLTTRVLPTARCAGTWPAILNWCFASAAPTASCAREPSLSAN